MFVLIYKGVQIIIRALQKDAAIVHLKIILLKLKGQSLLQCLFIPDQTTCVDAIKGALRSQQFRCYSVAISSEFVCMPFRFHRDGLSWIQMRTAGCLPDVFCALFFRHAPVQLHILYGAPHVCNEHAHAHRFLLAIACKLCFTGVQPA